MPNFFNKKKKPPTDTSDLKVHKVVPFESWEDDKCIRIDLKDVKRGGMVHLYVPAKHPLSTVTPGSSVKIIR